MPTSLRTFVPSLVAVIALVTLGAPAGAQTNPGSGTAVPRVAPRLAVPLFSARRVPDVVRTPLADAALLAQVQAIAAEAPPTSCISVSFQRRTVLRINADLPLVPASVNKLVTATAILHHAPPAEPVVTRVAAAAAPKDGIVEGNLWVIGGGDALLTTDGYKGSLVDQDQNIVEYTKLADEIYNAGVREIRGDIIGDDSRYDVERVLPSWPDRYQQQGTVGPLSALMVNDGSDGYARSPEKPVARRKPGDPPALAAETLRTLLTERQINVTGGAAVGKAPDGTVDVASVTSTIAQQVGEMLSSSDNTTAELLSKEVGRRASGAGTTAAGTAAALDVLVKAGVPVAPGVKLVDGSGLDEGNRLTCNLVTALLDKAGPDGTIAHGLPVAGKKGTLIRHIRGTVGEGNVRAKTGSLNQVTSLAGFEKTRQGGTVTFSFIQNGPKLNQALWDRLVEALYEYPQAPDLTDLAPPAAATAG